MGSLTPLLDVLRIALVLAVVLPVLIAAHELGHFWVARAFGMKVDAFAVMIGGVRKTRLDRYLARPLAPAGLVWAFGIASHLVLIIGAVQQLVPVTLAGLFLVGVLLPVWIATRLGALYHLPLGSTVGTLAKTWALALLLSFLGTRFQGLNTMQLMGLVSIASLVGVLVVYYQPVLRKSEDSAQGHGQIDIPLARVPENGDVTDLGNGSGRAPVLFRPLLSRTDRHGTEFSLLCWPLGGFAAIHGMQPKEDGSETKVEGGFYSKSPAARFLVLLAGPMFSVLFGVFILTGILCFQGKIVPSHDPVVGLVLKDGPAWKAGLQPGDRVLAVNGTSVTDFYDILSKVRVSFRDEGDKHVPLPVKLDIARGGQREALTIVPDLDEKPTFLLDKDFALTKDKAVQAKLKIRWLESRQRMPLGQAFVEAAQQPIEMVAGLVDTVQHPADIADNVGGPGMVAETVNDASKKGIADVLTIAALLSISLGVMNLLPIGPLDGGQLMVALAEILRNGRRLSYQFQVTLSTVGAFLVMALILFVVTLDIGRHAVR